ncbi:unnamed protein product [Linum trigynum]|uniref:Uncharacterized protein n=1 Tax=Linum trigynum TaxID=586398 RepID=A0AAV2G5D0_9ROSI
MYHYAHFQKAEIVSQLNKTLVTGLIQPSTSPFSLLVLLMKKKDRTWHFCMYYRALNLVTIKDRFPIPTVDDMLDELYGEPTSPSLICERGTIKSECTSRMCQRPL